MKYASFLIAMCGAAQELTLDEEGMAALRASREIEAPPGPRVPQTVEEEEHAEEEAVGGAPPFVVSEPIVIP